MVPFLRYSALVMRQFLLKISPSSSSYIKQLPVVKVLRFLRAAHRVDPAGYCVRGISDGAEDNPFGLDLQQDRIVLWRGEGDPSPPMLAVNRS